MKIKVSVFQFVKLSFFAMLFYSSFLMELLEIKIANMTLALGALTALLMLADMAVMNFNPLKIVTSDVQRILLFIVMCALSIVAANYRATAIDGMIQLVQCLLLMVITIYICMREGSLTFCARTIVIVMGLGAIHALTNMDSFNQRLALSETGNANVFGHNAVLGACMTPLAFKNDTRIKKILHIGLVILFTMAVVISASRMSFIALVGYLGIYLLVIAPRSIRPSRFSWGVRFLGVLGVAIVVLYFVSESLADTLVIDRMNELFNVLDTGEGDGEARLYLYEEAWKLFLQHPIFGVGYANFGPMHYGVYTHSTYAEILSCTGLMGFVPFVCYYLYISRELKKGVRLDNAKRLSTNHHLVLVFIVLLLLGIGEILIYKVKYFVVFGILAVQFYLNKEQIMLQQANQIVRGEK